MADLMLGDAVARNHLGPYRDKWHRWGEVDPLWAILTDARKRGNRWNRDEFFQTGRDYVDAMLARLSEAGFTPNFEGSALDFGCGVGRLTLPLADRFATVVGVDIAPSMLALARDFNTRPDNCDYLLNIRPDLSLLEDASFSFVQSVITLQHIPTEVAEKYVSEFVRVTARGGLVVFQVPASKREARTMRQALKRRVPQPIRSAYRRVRYGVGAEMDMFGMQPSRISELVASEGGRIVQAWPDRSGPPWDGFMYVVSRD